MDTPWISLRVVNAQDQHTLSGTCRMPKKTSAICVGMQDQNAFQLNLRRSDGAGVSSMNWTRLTVLTEQCIEGIPRLRNTSNVEYPTRLS